MVPEKERSASLRRYHRNRAKLLLQNKQWCQENRQKRTEYRRKYRATEKGRVTTLRTIKKYEANNPDRRKAWTLARKLESKPCVQCGRTSQKHHPDPSKPLEVIYLCPLHHTQIHMLQ